MDQLSKLVELTKGTSLSEYDTRIYVSAENANRTIYLADLPRNTSYMDVSEYYEHRIGSCQIAIKRPLFKNFYFAFVQFQKLEHAQKALAEHRFPVIKGQVCRALPYNMHSSFVGTVPQPNQKTRDQAVTSSDPQKQIFVKNIPSNWSHADLFEKFEQFGEITSAKISITANFESRCYGFVEFTSADSAQKAVAAMDGKVFSKDEDEAPSGEEDGKTETAVPLQVTNFESKRQRVRQGQESFCSTNLYVKNFPPKTQPGGSDSDGAASDTSPPTGTEEFNDSDLVELFKPFGEILSACVMRTQDGTSRGFGFVCFNNWQDAKKALDHFKKLTEEIQGVGGLYVSEFKSKEQRQQEVAKQTYQWKKSMMYMNLIIKNVDPSTTEQELKDFFTQFGNVNNVKLHTDASMAFVSFTDRESARAAKQAATEILFKGRHLFVNFVEPKETRRLHFEEKIDKKAYEKHQMHVMGSKNADLIQLISSLGLLMNQLQVGNSAGQQRGRMGGQMGGAPLRQNIGQQYQGNTAQVNSGGGMPLNGVVGHSHPGRYHNSNGYRQNSNSYGHNQRGGRMQNQHRPPMNGQVSGGSQMPYGQNAYQMQQHQNQSQPQMQQMSVAGSGSADSKGSQYQAEIFSMFNSTDFAQATAESRKEIIGTAIYKHVHEMVGEEHAPKVTGMIIDLDPVELNMSIQQYGDLQQKVSSAMQLLVTNNLVVTNGPGATAKGPGDLSAPTEATKGQSEVAV